MSSLEPPKRDEGFGELGWFALIVLLSALTGIGIGIIITVGVK